MANFALIQRKIYYGYEKAAIRLGTTHNIYRSTDGIDPIKAANLIGTRLISIDQNYKYMSAKKYGDPVWQFLMTDGLTLQNYDYMVSPGGINYFIVDIKPDNRLNPPTCVECNDIVSVFRTTSTRTAGENPYQTYNPATTPTLLKNCPASVLQHNRTDAQNMKLPTSVKLPFYSILLPEFDDIIIKTGDVIIDSKGRRYAAINAERTKKSLGFRIIAGELGN